MKSKKLANIHEFLNEPMDKYIEQVKYNMSTRNSSEDNNLRKLLVEVHNDSQLAEFVKKRRCYTWLYDPDPDNECGWYLDWGSSKDKVHFAYRQPVWGMGRGGDVIPFELYKDRFYANGTELLDLFPDLTTSKLEEGIKNAIKEDKQFKAKN